MRDKTSAKRGKFFKGFKCIKSIRFDTFLLAAFLSIIFFIPPELAFSRPLSTVDVLRHSSTSVRTRIVLNMSKAVEFSQKTLANPDRVYFDFREAKIRRGVERRVRFYNGEYKTVRISQFNPDTVRFVLDISPKEHEIKVSTLKEPFRLVFDIYQKGAEALPNGEEPLKTIAKAKTTDAAPPVSAEVITEPPVLQTIDPGIAATTIESVPVQPQKEGFDLKQIKPADSAKTITAIEINKLDRGAKIIIKGDGVIPDPDVLKVDGEIVIDMPNVSLTAVLPKNFVYPVKNINASAARDGVRLTISTDGATDAEALSYGYELAFHISAKDTAAAAAKKDDFQKLEKPKASKLVSLDFQDADIVSILRLLGDVSGYNLVIHPDVKGKITMKLMNVPWEQALEIILKTFNLEKVIEGNVIRVATLKAFQEERKTVAETREIFGKAEDVESRVFSLRYADPEKIKEEIDKAKIVSARGNVSADTRTRSIIVKDTPTNIAQVESLIATLDQTTPQVLIETRIVEMSTNTARELGIEWGGHAQSFNQLNTAKGSGGTGSIPGGSATNPAIISLPTTSTAGAITLGYLNAAQTLGLDMRLSAYENAGKAKIISNPKVVTSDNQKAKIVQGESIPYGVRDPQSGQISAAFKDVGISIDVTPQITSVDSIFINVETKKEELLEFVNIGGGAQAPRTTKIEGNTKVQVRDGETMVLGGIYKESSSDSTTGVPGLMHLPLLGSLFKSTTTKSDTREVLIFITPRIVSAGK
ncbi:MAG: type IV pilus secretin PilQ [Nitrospirae bacterium]|nr:type IV pilus secretin PilQ [Nitrospirota bacterium]